MKYDTLFDIEVAFEELMDHALNVLTPEHFEMLMDYIQKALADYEQGDE